jgi:hypothetical protein
MRFVKKEKNLSLLRIPIFGVENGIILSQGLKFHLFMCYPTNLCRAPTMRYMLPRYWNEAGVKADTL